MVKYTVNLITKMFSTLRHHDGEVTIEQPGFVPAHLACTGCRAKKVPQTMGMRQ
jgi:hypothetical protein